jgi:sec-independent protein translocase protein TatB
VFGVSFTELLLVLLVALVVLGPERLPVMMRTVGLWLNKIRKMTSEVRAQSGIDELLRKEGFHGGLAEVRALLHGDPRTLLQPLPEEPSKPLDDPYVNGPIIDETRERPTEGPDAYGAIPEDLLYDSETRSPIVSEASYSTENSTTKVQVSPGES